MKKKKQKPIFENCIVLEAGEKSALIQAGEYKIVARTPKKLEKGERVSLFKAATFPKALEIFLYLIPLYFFALSFGFGFFFKNSLTHYLVTLGASLLGILVLLVLRFTIGKMPENKFIAIKEGEENENCSKRWIWKNN